MYTLYYIVDFYIIIVVKFIRATLSFIIYYIITNNIIYICKNIINL